MTGPRLGLLLALTLGACDSTGPGASGPPYFRATLDGTSWEADTSLGLAFGAPTDTSITLTAVRRVSPTESQEITVFLRHWGRGPVPIGDTSSAAVGVFSVTQIEGDSATGFLSYFSTANNPGQLVITSLNRGDSLITGTWTFEAQSTPDTLPHRHVAVEFRIRYSLQPVFVPAAVPMPPNYRMKLTSSAIGFLDPRRMRSSARSLARARLGAQLMRGR